MDDIDANEAEQLRAHLRHDHGRGGLDPALDTSRLEALHRLEHVEAAAGMIRLGHGHRDRLRV